MKSLRTKDPEAIGSSLDWKEFEAFVESAFCEYGFKTQKNVRLKKPRAEIDLVASKNDLVFAVDCKHWKKTVGYSLMLGISQRQLERGARYAKTADLMRVVPVVVTLRDESLRILENGVPIVPIHRLSDFILNWEEALDHIAVIRQKRKSFSIVN